MGFVQGCQYDYSKPKELIKASKIFEIFDSKLNYTNNYINMIKALSTGPIVAMMEVPLGAPNLGLDFYTYADGIYTTPYCGKCVPAYSSTGSVTKTSLNTCFGRLNHGM